MPATGTNLLDGEGEDPNLPQPEEGGHGGEEGEDCAEQDADPLLQVHLSLLQIFCLAACWCPWVDLVIKNIWSGCHLLQPLQVMGLLHVWQLV